jgi:CheY-like chemotaxis protein
VRLIREALRLKGLNFEIEHSATAEGGVRIVQSYQSSSASVPEVILLDYNLPGGTACDILAAIKKNPTLDGVRKAVLTCSVAPKDREQVLSAGADIFVFKPSNFDDFVNNVGTAVLDLLNRP